MIFYKGNGVYGENYAILFEILVVNHIAHIKLVEDNGYEKH